MSVGGAGLDCSKTLLGPVGRLSPSATLPSATWHLQSLTGSCFSLSSSGADFYSEWERQCGFGFFTVPDAQRCWHCVGIIR